MATSKPKESCGLGKERKITAPSSVTIPNTPTKRTPKSSPRATSTDHKPFSSTSTSTSASSSTHPLSTPTEKHVPNYLKSTASSRHDHSSFKPIKKPAGGPAPIPDGGKPSLNRRRSFDKPPPTAPRLEKPFRSPGPRNRAPHVPIRSSSFGAKPSTTIISSASAKPGFLERSASKISKVGGGKPQQAGQNLKSSSNVKKSLKRDSSNASSASAEVAPKTKNGVEHVDQSPHFALGVNDEELKKIEYELDRYLPDPTPEFDKELRTTDQVEIDEAENKKLPHDHQPIQDTEIFKVDVSNKEVEETAETETSPSLIREEENRKEEEEEDEEEEPDRVIAVEKDEVVASEESTNNKNEETCKTETETETVREEGGEGVVVLDEKEAQDGQSCKEESNNSTTKAETTETEAEATEKVATTTTAAAAAAEKDAETVANIAGKARQGGPGRKESPAMYNDVIEETASKLLEKRKNKVRALAGAFQTVIDYESSSK